MISSVAATSAPIAQLREALAKAILDRALSVWLIKDADSGVIVAASPAFLTRFPGAVGKRCSDFMSLENVADIVSTDSHALMAGGPVDVAKWVDGSLWDGFKMPVTIDGTTYIGTWLEQRM